MEDATFPSAPFLTDDRNLWPSPMSNDCKEEEDRHYEYVANGGDPRYCLNFPKGKISEETLIKMSVYACKGYQVGPGANAKSYLCPDRAILWRNYDTKRPTEYSATWNRCVGCEEKHDKTPCSCRGSRYCCDDI